MSRLEPFFPSGTAVEIQFTRKGVFPKTEDCSRFVLGEVRKGMHDWPYYVVLNPPWDGDPVCGIYARQLEQWDNRGMLTIQPPSPSPTDESEK